jgi:hypothetical protein
MPRKLPEHFDQLYFFLRKRLPKNWLIKKIHNITEEKVYKELLISKIFLAFLLLFSFILSVLFWSNGEYKSLIHILDGIFSKTVAILFFLYIFLIKKEKKYSQLLPLIIFIIILILFYMSNKYSNNTWCSKDHIIIHSIFHLFSMIALLFAFI